LPLSYTLENGETKLAGGLLDTRIGVVSQVYNDGSDARPVWKKTGRVLNNYVTGNLTAKIPVGVTNIPSQVNFTCLYI
jgi:hypothetical protein